MADDPRLAVVAGILLDTGDSTDDAWITAGHIIAALNAAAALSASPPARVGVPVRIAVGLQTVVEAGMERDWGIYKLRGDEPDESAWAYLNSIGYAFRAAILTATIQPPVVAEIAAAVEKP